MRKNSTYNLLALLILLSVSMTATASDEGYALLIQASPSDAGSVTPGLGVHKMAIGQSVALSAVPKPGYRFLYWLGDVSSTSGAETTVSIDSPKLVVAVFTREGFEEELPGAGIEKGMYSPGGGRGYYPIQSPGTVSPGVNYESPSFPSIPELPEEPTDDDIPVPGDTGDNDDIPVPGDNEIPEPASILLLGGGATILLRRRRK